MGILFALLALGSWGVGDFLIQRSARKLGVWVALFYITAFATAILLPFVWQDLLLSITEASAGIWILGTASIVTLFAALFDFEALRIGKISVIEPVYALEITVTAVLAAIIIAEHLTFVQIFIIGILFCGILLVSTRSLQNIWHIRMEKGVWYAVLATIAMGGVNFLFGWGARETNPLLINWFTSAFIAISALAYLFFTGQAMKIIGDWKHNKRLILGVSIIDNTAWIAFAYSTLYIPIAIATAISESYIALAAGLGIYFNREKLKRHQFVGLILAVTAVLVLAAITAK